MAKYDALNIWQTTKYSLIKSGFQRCSVNQAVFENICWRVLPNCKLPLKKNPKSLQFVSSQTVNMQMTDLFQSL